MKMKNQPFVSGRLYAAAWAILPEAHAELSALYRQYLAGELPAMAMGDEHDYDEYSSAPWEVIAGTRVAVVSFAGVIAKAAPKAMSGPRFADLDDLSASLEAIGRDDSVDTVVLHLNSPGGQAIGMEEIAADIRDLREKKRVVAYSDLQMCSAAYWIACACDEIFASPSAMVGSIGTYVAGLDSSRKFEMEGLELKLFRDGDLKAIGHPGKRWTEEEEQYLRDMVAKTGARFKAHVRAARGPIADEAMQGQWWHAADAPAGIVAGVLHRNLASLVVAEIERR